MKKFYCALLIVLSCTGPNIAAGMESSAAMPIMVSIGTGDITGVYYPAGGAIAKIVNKKREIYGIRCMVESTAGSVYNINEVISGDLNFGIVQSDRQYQAFNGLAEWKKKGPQKELRAVFAIHSEAVTLLAAADAGIKRLVDLKGKRINIGNHGGGFRQNAIDALQINGLNYQKDLKSENLKASEAFESLQAGRIDALFYTVGHPSAAVKKAVTGSRKTVFIPIPNIEGLTGTYPYYVKTKISKMYYDGVTNTTDVETFGVKATVVTTSKTPDEVVYIITKEVFENLEEFKTLHTAFQDLVKEDMLTGMSAPIHPGAMKYYQETGLINSSKE